MANKKDRLIQKAAATARKPKPERIAEVEKKKGYKVVAVSLYTPEAEWVDKTVRILQSAGNPKANRSLVIREAILKLQENLHGKNPEEILYFFLESQRKSMAEQ